MTAKEFTERVLLATIPKGAPPFFKCVCSAHFSHGSGVAYASILAFDGSQQVVQVSSDGYLFTGFEGHVDYKAGKWRFVIDYHEVSASWGHLIIDARGKVLTRYLDSAIPQSDPLNRNITKVDLKEWRRYWKRPVDSELHFADIAYWYQSPDTSELLYQRPDMEWRREDGVLIKNLWAGIWAKKQARLKAYDEGGEELAAAIK